MEQQEKLLGDGELFAVVEVMGHNTFAGRVREQVIGGSAFIRVDVPELLERKKMQYGHVATYPAIPGFTKLIGAGSIYAITPCSEEVARQMAEAQRSVPVSVVDVSPKYERLAIEAPGDDNGDDEDEE